MAQMIIAPNRDTVKDSIVKWLNWHGKRHATDAQSLAAKTARTAAQHTADTLAALSEELAGIPIIDPDAPDTALDRAPTLSVRFSRETLDRIKREAAGTAMSPRTFCRLAVEAALARIENLKPD